jgi:hypothetical protein
MNKRTTTSQEVLAPRAPTSGYSSLVIRYGAEDLEVRLEILAQVHYRSDVATAVAIVRCRPHGDDVFVFEVVLDLLAPNG